MKVGIVSDSHGDAGRLRSALRVLAERGADAIVHCGDVGSIQCVRALGAAGAAAYLVLGNMDRHARELAGAARDCGVNLHWEVVEVEIAEGRHLAATHGHDAAILRELIAEGQFPYVCHGHTHEVRDERVGKTRVINPGALRHSKHPRRPTVALLDTQTDTLEFIDVPR